MQQTVSRQPAAFTNIQKRIFMLKYMININFNTIYVNILQKNKKNIHLKY